MLTQNSTGLKRGGAIMIGVVTGGVLWWLFGMGVMRLIDLVR